MVDKIGLRYGRSPLPQWAMRYTVNLMQRPISGSVVIRCKTPNCPGGYTGDFVFDLEEWKEGFKDQARTCETCNKTYIYSQNDVTLIPAKDPAEKEVDKTSAKQNPKEGPSKE